MRQYSLGGNQFLQDVDSKIPVNISHKHGAIHFGSAHMVSDRRTLGSAGTITYLVSIPASIYPHLKFHVQAVEDCLIDVFKDVTASSNGSSLSTKVINMNLASSSRFNTTLTWFHTPTISASTQIAWLECPQNGSMEFFASGDENEIIGNADTKMAITITSEAAANKVCFIASWYETGTEYAASSESSTGSSSSTPSSSHTDSSASSASSNSSSTADSASSNSSSSSSRSSESTSSPSSVSVSSNSSSSNSSSSSDFSSYSSNHSSASSDVSTSSPSSVSASSPSSASASSPSSVSASSASSASSPSSNSSSSSQSNSSASSASSATSASRSSVSASSNSSSSNSSSSSSS